MPLQRQCGRNNIIAVALVHSACTCIRPDHISNVVLIHVAGCECVPVHSNVDREIFTLKIIRLKKFCVQFSRFCSICEIFLTVDGSNMDERLESSWRLVYYQVSG